ncbi:MAG TPA: EamA family transporter [Candidatus Limnocylindria bacterium]|nr:EamA family transporter [Candidatus Limnocylindria bacterium]
MPSSRVESESPATYTAFAGCALIWGSTFLFISIGNDTVPPLWAAALRLAVAAAILWLVGLLTRQPLPRGAALRAAIGYGVFQFGGNLSLLYWGETVVPSGLAAVIFATVPLSTALIGRAFGLERLSRGKVGAALIAMAGVAIMFSGERASTRWLPTLAILIATWLACVGVFILKRGPRQAAIGANAVGSVVGFVVCLLLSWLLGEPHALPSGAAAIVPILYLAVAGSVGAFVIYTWLINRWPVSRASYIAVVIPIVAVALGVLVRGERLHAASVIGSVVVLLGVIAGLRAAPAAAPGRGVRSQPKSQQ